MAGKLETEDIWGPYHKRKEPNYDLYLQHKANRRAMQEADSAPEYTDQEIRDLLRGYSTMPR